MDKVLIHDDGPNSGLVHTTVARFIDAKETTCGVKLHPISTLRARRLPITCEKCLHKLADGELKAEMDIVVNDLNRIMFSARMRGLGVGVATVTGGTSVKLDVELKRGHYNIKW